MVDLMVHIETSVFLKMRLSDKNCASQILKVVGEGNRSGLHVIFRPAHIMCHSHRVSEVTRFGTSLLDPFHEQSAWFAKRKHSPTRPIHVRKHNWSLAPKGHSFLLQPSTVCYRFSLCRLRHHTVGSSFVKDSWEQLTTSTRQSCTLTSYRFTDWRRGVEPKSSSR